MQGQSKKEEGREAGRMPPCLGKGVPVPLAMPMQGMARCFRTLIQASPMTKSPDSWPVDRPDLGGQASVFSAVQWARLLPAAHAGHRGATCCGFTVRRPH